MKNFVVLVTNDDVTHTSLSRALHDAPPIFYHSYCWTSAYSKQDICQSSEPRDWRWATAVLSCSEYVDRFSCRKNHMLFCWCVFCQLYGFNIWLLFERYRCRPEQYLCDSNAEVIKTICSARNLNTNAHYSSVGSTFPPYCGSLPGNYSLSISNSFQNCTVSIVALSGTLVRTKLRWHVWQMFLCHPVNVTEASDSLAFIVPAIESTYIPGIPYVLRFSANSIIDPFFIIPQGVQSNSTNYPFLSFYTYSGDPEENFSPVTSFWADPNSNRFGGDLSWDEPLYLSHNLFPPPVGNVRQREREKRRR